MMNGQQLSEGRNLRWTWWLVNGLDELCGWLLNVLEVGSLVTMVEIAIEYEHILKWRRENCTESMLRRTYIRDRLGARYGTVLHFEKMNKYTRCVKMPWLLTPVFQHSIGHCGRIGWLLKLRSTCVVDVRCLYSAGAERYPLPAGNHWINDVHSWSSSKIK